MECSTDGEHIAIASNIRNQFACSLLMDERVISYRHARSKIVTPPRTCVISRVSPTKATHV